MSPPRDSRSLPARVRSSIAYARRLTRVVDLGPVRLPAFLLARRLAPWWDGWERGFTAAGGRADLWRLDEPLPETVALLGRAAGLDPSALGGRSLFLPARA